MFKIFLNSAKQIQASVCVKYSKVRHFNCPGQNELNRPFMKTVSAKYFGKK